MATFSPDPMTGLKIEMDEQEFRMLYKLFTQLFSKKKDKYINYDVDFHASYYKNEKNWLLLPNGLKTPYLLLHDFRRFPDSKWGSYSYKGMFDFPNELDRIKTLMVKKFTEEKKLKKGDNDCPRVSRVKIADGRLNLEIQHARYYHQVATNLSIDYRYDSSFERELMGCSTMRDWDLLQSQAADGLVPGFEVSKLANTIGIAVGLTAKNKYNQKMVIARRRTSTVAVYGDQLSVPFSFALNVDFNRLKNAPKASILDLIYADLRHEQADELGLEPSQIDLSNLKPLFFCRDMARGGKPQFFFEVDSKLPFEAITQKINERQGNKEFKRGIQSMPMDKAEELNYKISPELLAFIAGIQ